MYSSDRYAGLINPAPGRRSIEDTGEIIEKGDQGNAGNRDPCSAPAMKGSGISLAQEHRAKSGKGNCHDPGCDTGRPGLRCRCRGIRQDLYKLGGLTCGYGNFLGEGFKTVRFQQNLVASWCKAGKEARALTCKGRVYKDPRVFGRCVYLDSTRSACTAYRGAAGDDMVNTGKGGLGNKLSGKPVRKVTVVIPGEKSAVITLPAAEFWSDDCALVKSMGAVWYSVPVGSVLVTAKPFKRSVASDFEKVSTCGGSELVASPFVS